MAEERIELSATERDRLKTLQTLEADISILRKTGHFYFALTVRSVDSIDNQTGWTEGR